MEPDTESCLTDITGKVGWCFITDSEGNRIKIGEALDVSAEKISEKSKETDILRRSFIGTFKFKMSSKCARRWKVFVTTTIENSKLSRIMKNVKKERVKKKLLGRIWRNIYEQVKCGL